MKVDACAMVRQPRPRPEEQDRYTISEAVAFAGLAARALRWCEWIGLMSHVDHAVPASGPRDRTAHPRRGGATGRAWVVLASFAVRVLAVTSGEPACERLLGVGPDDQDGAVQVFAVAHGRGAETGRLPLWSRPTMPTS